MISKPISLKIKLFTTLLFLLSYGIGVSAQTAHWQIRPIYESVDVLTESLLKVKSNGRFGLCDYKGTSIVECLYDDFPHFKDGYMLIIENGFVRGNVTLHGKVTRFAHDYVVDVNYPYYSEGLLAVKYNGRWGYIDISGNVVIDFKYRNALPFMKGLASVSDFKGNFVHINRSGQISLLSSGFNDDDLKFATSFITDDKGETFALVVNSKWKAYKRDVRGKKLGSFELTGVTIDTKARILKSGKYTLYFDPAWRLLRLDIQNQTQKEYVINDHLSSGYAPQIKSLKPSAKSLGLCGLVANDILCLPKQFESLLPLNSELVLVSQGGLFGILRLNRNEAIDIELDVDSYTMNHRTSCEIGGSIRLSDSLIGKSIEFMTIMCEDSNEIVPNQSGNSFIFNYTPDNLNGGHRQNFQIKVKVDGLEYPTFNKSIYFAHKSSFKVSCPDKVSLNENGYCQFYIYITNTSEQRSDRSEIYVDDVLVKTQDSFNGGQRISVLLKKSINMEDEDLKTKILNIRVVEKGCPDYVDSKKVTYERYYANN